MSPAMQRKFASMGGKAVPERHRAFKRDPELARLAGGKGGKAPRRSPKLGATR